MVDAEIINAIKKFHSPRMIVQYNGDRISVCKACEINFWPCITYKLATGQMVEAPVEPDVCMCGTEMICMSDNHVESVGA